MEACFEFPGTRVGDGLRVAQPILLLLADGAVVFVEVEVEGVRAF
jgi:hypothetical protein